MSLLLSFILILNLSSMTITIMERGITVLVSIIITVSGSAMMTNNLGCLKTLNQSANWRKNSKKWTESSISTSLNMDSPLLTRMRKSFFQSHMRWITIGLTTICTD